MNDRFKPGGIKDVFGQRPNYELQYNRGVAPSNTVAPVISGTNEVGEVLTTTNGTWEGTTPITYTYQWYNGGTMIIGETLSTYTQVYSDIGDDITCKVTATNDSGNATATSNIIVTSLTVQAMVDQYGFTNAWGAENKTISGTTTTLHDYKLEHDLSNPLATNQPTFNAIGNIGNGKPTLSFTTDDYLYKAVSDWRGADDSGEVVLVFRDTGNSPYVLTSCDEATTNFFFASFRNVAGGNSFEFYCFDNTTNRRMRGTSDIITGSPDVISSWSTAGNATNYNIIINGTNESVTAVLGLDDGATWLADIANRDNIVLGALVRSATVYGEVEIAFAGYRPFTSIANSQLVQTDLATYYGT